MIGAAVAGSLGVLVALVENGPIPALVSIIILVVSNQFGRRILEPAFRDGLLRIHGLVAILALAGGATLAGVIGTLIAVPAGRLCWRSAVWVIGDTLGPRGVPDA